jgi:hypothetical protein
MISAMLSLVLFSLWTLVYFLGKYYAVDRYLPLNNNSVGSLPNILLLVYLFLVVISQIIINVLNTGDLCNGQPQWSAAIMYTLLPNFFIFVTLVMLLKIFPGWKSPFSNTIGYLVVSLMGVGKSFAALNPCFNKGIPIECSQSKIIQKFAEDNSLIINEITPENFFSYFEELAKNKLIKADYKTVNDISGKSAFHQIWKYICIKNNIAEGLWYILTGMLVISTTYNTILDIKCYYTSSQIENQMNSFSENQKKEKEEKGEEKTFAITD